MKYVDWQPGMIAEAPVYLDANVVVGAIIRGHRLYRSCTKLLGDLLVNRSPMLVSILSLEESLWGLVRWSYCDLNRQRPDAHFNQHVYKRQCAKIFQAYGSRIAAVGSMLQDWARAGAPVEVVPKTETVWGAIHLAPTYMRQLKLTPADAFHLAFAQTHARTFITGDSDFAEVNRQSYPGDLVILHLVPS